MTVTGDSGGTAVVQQFQQVFASKTFCTGMHKKGV